MAEPIERAHQNANPQSPPAPDDLAGWKAAEKVLSKLITDRIHSSNLANTTTLRQFFGCKNEEYLLDEYKDWSVMNSFIEWLVNDYRPVYRNDNRKMKDKIRRRLKSSRPGKTLAEKMLSADLPAAQARLLEACSQTNPSFFRTISVEAGSSLVAEDILLGGQKLIHDKMLSGCVEAGQVLVGRVFPVGQFRFFSSLGPPLSNILTMRAVEYLESLGVEMTREGLLRGATKFGRLWAWYDQRAEEGFMPSLHNTDGHELIWHTASFFVSDEKSTRQALASREDIDYDEETDDYRWFRDQEQDAKIPGDTLSLGNIRFVLNELILEVNSAERFEAARKWLTKIPGVKYLDVQIKDLTSGPSDVPMDDRMGPKETVEITPELVSHLQELFHQHYMKWLDDPLPMLEGKTPRQMCRKKSGREKVAMLIRTIPNPASNQGISINVPREEMFQELGLQSE